MDHPSRRAGPRGTRSPRPLRRECRGKERPLTLAQTPVKSALAPADTRARDTRLEPLALEAKEARAPVRCERKDRPASTDARATTNTDVSERSDDHPLVREGAPDLRLEEKKKKDESITSILLDGPEGLALALQEADTGVPGADTRDENRNRKKENRARADDLASDLLAAENRNLATEDPARSG